jgi:hypothetical protein
MKTARETLILSANEFDDIYLGGEDLIGTQVSGQSRWSTFVDVFFRRGENVYVVNKEEGSTEYQYVDEPNEYKAYLCKPVQTVKWVIDYVEEAA